MRFSTTILALTTLLCAATATAQSKMSPRTMIFVDSYANPAKQALGIRQVAPTAETTKFVNAFVHIKSDDAIETLSSLGCQVSTVAGGIAVTAIPADMVAQIAELDEVSYVEICPAVNPRMHIAKGKTFAANVLAGSDGLARPYTGNGVVFGLVDGGLEYAHVNFYNTARTQLRVKRVWNQNSNAGTPPAGLTYGTELATESAIINAKYDIDETHGTHVCGIAAGGLVLDNGTDYRGAAPDADIVMVSYNEAITDNNCGTIIDGIKYIFDYATSVGKPAVVNLSLGQHYGPHDGTSSFDLMLDALTGPGRLVVGSAGNEGDDELHISKTFTGNSSEYVATFPCYYSASYQQSQIDIWGEPGTTFTVTPIVFDFSRNYEMDFEPVEASVEGSRLQTYTFNNASHYTSGSVQLGSEINPVNNRPHATATINTNYVSGTTRALIGLKIKSNSPGTVHAWADDIYSFLSSYDYDGYTNGDTDCTIGELGGTAKSIISVGAYTSSKLYKNNGIPYQAKNATLDDITYFSSKGPTADGRVKPDVAAPGQMILSSLSSNYPTSMMYRDANVTWNGEKYYMGYEQGTSMASPVVAGILTSWLEARPELAPAHVQSILRSTSISDSFTGTTPNNTWGYGKINSLDGIKAALALDLAGVDHVAADANPMVVLIAGRRLRVMAAVDLGMSRIDVYSTDGRLCAHLAAPSLAAGEELTFDIDTLAKGTYVARVTTSHGVKSIKFAN